MGRRDPFIIDIAALPDEDNYCETCYGTGWLHWNSATQSWDSCLALEAGGRCCDGAKQKYCPTCEGSGEKPKPA